MRRLFLFRPEPAASRTAERARAIGLEPAVVPLFEIEPVPWHAPDPTQFDAILLTSANAVRFVPERVERLRTLPVHAVGEATAAAAREAGLRIASTGNDGVERLLGSIEPGRRLLHLCGEERRDIGAACQAVTPLVVYRAKALPPPAELNEIGGQVGAVHSPRAAARLAELVSGRARAKVRLAAISTAAAEAAGAGWEWVESADSPTDAALLACAARLCDKA